MTRMTQLSGPDSEVGIRASKPMKAGDGSVDVPHISPHDLTTSRSQDLTLPTRDLKTSRSQDLFSMTSPQDLTLQPYLEISRSHLANSRSHDLEISQRPHLMTSPRYITTSRPHLTTSPRNPLTSPFTLRTRDLTTFRSQLPLLASPRDLTS
jgi:hypothetical protein